MLLELLPGSHNAKIGAATIYSHNEDAKKSQVEGVIRILGYEQVIRLTSGAHPKIEFITQ